MDRPNSKKVQYRLGAFNTPCTISRYVVGHGWPSGLCSFAALHEANSEVRASRFEVSKLGRGGRRPSDTDIAAVDPNRSRCPLGHLVGDG